VPLLERRVPRIDHRIDQAIQAEDEKAELWSRIQAVPSVGPGVARALIVDLPELGHLTRRQISSLLGLLAPFTEDSGRKLGQRRIRTGRATLGSALYRATMNGARYDPVLKGMHERLIAAVKPKKVGLVALARKRLTILDAMVREGSESSCWPRTPLGWMILGRSCRRRCTHSSRFNLAMSCASRHSGSGFSCASQR